MKSLSFDEFIDRINYDKEATQKQQKELRHWLEMIGEYKYDKYYKVLHKEETNITFEDIKNCATYDFNLSRILFAVLKHCENYLRATITSNIDDFDLNSDNYPELIRDKFGLEDNWMHQIKWPQFLEDESSFYKFIDASGLFIIIECFLNLTLDGIIFDPIDLEENLHSVRIFRNHVYHHNCLLDDNFKKNELKSKIMMLFRYVPSPSIRRKYIDFIHKETERVGNKYSYPIRFSHEEKNEIMNYRGCINEHKD